MVTTGFRRLLLTGTVVLSGISMISSALAAESVHLATSEFPPYMSATMPDQGIVVAIAHEAFKRVGYSTKISFFPWARLMHESKAGRVDGVAGLWPSTEREQWFVFSNRVAQTQVGLYMRNDKPISYKSLSDLKPYTVGTVRDYANPKAFDEAKLKVDVVGDDVTNLRKLASGRIDLALIDKGVARYLISTKAPETASKVSWIDPPIEKKYLTIALSKKAPDYEKKLAAFNQGMALMEKDGTLAKMLEKAGL
ncbi:substrate-binding periplasmic protein [Chitinimonas lacunae]|uniref:Substrate-binding periplasmic protein n=1 Tax=Chitinimonas lacunae TaxID=1963018 RepID=A0ABV8MSZ0_9NEIS